MRRKPKFNRGWFLRGHDPRRHRLTAEERKRGGLACAKKYTICGGQPWPLDWMDHCSKRKKGEY
jgi:hypothetical protein